MEELKEMLRNLKANQDDIKSVKAWVVEIDKEVKKLWSRLHKIESEMQSTMTEIKINTAKIDTKLDSKIDLMNSKIDALAKIVELKEHYEQIAKGDTEAGRKSLRDDYRFWIMAILAIITFLAGLSINVVKLLTGGN